jgi:phosphate transport system substrate-binding protein
VKIFTYIILTIIIIGCASFNQNHSNVIKIKGSDTMLLLNQRLAQEFMKNHKGISVHVDGGGSATGVNALLNNTVDICAASRPLESDEIKKMGEQYGTVGMSFLIARDALSIYVNKSNPIKNLTLEEISKIYLCEIMNWKEIGGLDQMINPVSRTVASGTHIYFSKHVLKGKEICSSIKELNTTNEIIDFVKDNPSSIGYGGIGYEDSLMQCSISGIEPTRENVINNSYPISRYLRYYTIRKPSGNIKLFIDWVTSSEGQKIVEKINYFPLWD